MTRMIDKDYLLLHTRKVRFFGIGPDDESWGYAVPVEVIENALTHTPPNEWVSVEERRPKYNIREDGELISSKILCYCETDKTVHLVVSQKFYTARKGEIVHPVFRYYDEWGDEIEDVSHWMHLPAPPGTSLSNG